MTESHTATMNTSPSTDSNNANDHSTSSTDIINHAATATATATATDSFKQARPPSIGINFQNATVLKEDAGIADSRASSSSRHHLHHHPQLLQSGAHTTLTVPNSASAAAASNANSSINGESPLFSSNERHYILLPYQNDPVSHFALDIGGTLIKMVYFEPTLSQTPTTPTTPDSSLSALHSNHATTNNGGGGGDLLYSQFDSNLSRQLPPVTVATKAPSVPVQQLGGRLCFAKFETENIDKCISFIKSMGNRLAHPLTIDATGGGAYKFEGKFKAELGLELRKIDEMQSVITGLNFLLGNLPNESFTYTLKQQRKNYETVEVESMYPYLLVNIGSGVSIVRVDGENKFERVSGSSLGGGTFWGLCRLLTNSNSFDEVLEMCLSGDNSKADMLVGDIYGSSYANVGLSSDTIASSMGKPVRKGLSKESIAPGDIAKSLLFMISNNIGQIAYLNAIRYGLKRIYFGGFFIRDHPITMGCISYAINYWSKGEMKAFFLQHEGYLGALGAFFVSERLRSAGIPNDQTTAAPTKATNNTMH